MTDDQELWLNRSRAIVSTLKRKLKIEAIKNQGHTTVTTTITDNEAFLAVVWLIEWAELVQNQLEALTESPQDDEAEFTESP